MSTVEPIALDPEMREAMRGIAEAAPPPAPDASMADRRRYMATTRRWLNDGTPRLPSVTERVVTGPLGPVKLRLYRPAEDAVLPIVVYFHGGGWVAGSLDTHDRLSRMLATESGFAVISVDWSLAPEHPFPQPVDEAVAVLAAIQRDAPEMGLDGARMAVGGDSAGANIALGALLTLGDNPLSLRAGVMFYGVYDCDLDTGTYLRFGGGDYQLTREAMASSWSHYVPDVAKRSDPRAAPVNAKPEALAKALPPLWLAAAEFDPLLDDHRRMVRCLKNAGVSHEETLFDGVVHGFAGTSLVVAKARSAIAEAGAFLRRQMGS